MPKQSTTVAMRECGDCTACCEGWHTSEIRGHRMFPGRPCHFFRNGCTIYKFRPDSCKDYYCAWVMDEHSEFPEWMRPDLSGIICDWREWEGTPYLEVRETYKKMDANTLSWIYDYGAQHGLNMRIKIDGYYHIHGSPEFVEAFDNDRYI